MWARKAFKMVVRPLSALSLVVPMFGVLGGEVSHGADRGVCDRAVDRGLAQFGQSGCDGVDVLAVGCVEQQLERDHRTGDQLVCGRGGFPLGRDVGVGCSRPGGCVGDPGPSPQFSATRARARCAGRSRSRPEVPFATLMRKARARLRASRCAARFVLLREAMISTNVSSSSSGVSSSSFWAFSRVVMARILAHRTGALSCQNQGFIPSNHNGGNTR